MSDTTWMLYGANGFTGRLIAAEAHRRGLRPIIAGRNGDAIRQVAGEHGFEARVFGLDDPARVAENLAGVSAVLLAAGPFSQTSAPVLEACLAAGIHYLDVTGELAIYAACHARSDDAERAGCVVMPGVGFDVVPSDCLAASLAEGLPEAESLELAFATDSFSKGTAITTIESLPAGGCVRKDGKLVPAPLGERSFEVAFRDRPRVVMSIPWGDLFTAYRSTGIPNITTHVAVPRRMVTATRLLRPMFPALKVEGIQALVKRGVKRAMKDPDREAIAGARAQLWGRVTAKDGTVVDGTLTTPEAYTLTAQTAVESVSRVTEGRVPPGAHTPVTAFGAAYITEIGTCELHINPPRRARAAAN